LDYLESLRDDLPDAPVKTETTFVDAASIISRNSSPDIGFDRSINPYLGCEHGCVYCFARPTHAYLGLSPGLDFETRLTAKANAADLLRRELSRPSYEPRLIALGANTDPYQPIEREARITRAVLEVLAEFNHPVAITTKSALVVRDIDLLAPMAIKGLARVAISICTTDGAIARTMEPRANTPDRRFQAVERLAQAGIPTTVIVAPIVPALTDAHLERVVERAAQAGADSAGYVLLRLPLEVRDLFVEWLEAHFPLRAKHVMSLVNQMRGGKDYDSAFGTRMKGTGLFAELIARRFEIACARHGLNRTRTPLNTALFQVPGVAKPQMDLF
ncbi:MAG: repair photolyase, partial [Novosphingobium sp.]|nr:repair photolyase [Novosphingobium sp.]